MEIELCGKHAFLIIAHKNDYTLQNLLCLLDDERNDIFIHMDRKNIAYSEEWAKQHVKRSRIVHVKRTSVTWGGYSLVRAEILLLAAATSMGRYEYYHLLSGEDLPIKSIDHIHEKMEINNTAKNIEYVGITDDERNAKFIDVRLRKYHLFQDKIGRKTGLLSTINGMIVGVQCKMNIKRNKDITFYRGSQWFSITDDFARYVISQEQWIRKHFKYTFVPDEAFMQTLIMNSPFKNNVNAIEEKKATMRLIDWERGKPYVFKREDLELIQNSDMLFARKFDCSVDSDIIKRIAKIVQNN